MQQYAGIITMVAVLAIFYLIIFIPENKRRKKYNQMLNDLKVNDEVVSKGGIIGKVINIKDEYIVLETGPDRARVKLNKNGIGSVISGNNDNKEETEDKKKK